MNPWPDITAAIAHATGDAFHIEQRIAVSGGCINSAWRIEDQGQRYFVKTNSSAYGGMFAAEAAGLSAIAATRTLRVPQPVCHGANRNASWLVLEYIELSRKSNMRLLGAQLAALHRVTGRHYGWPHSNTIGATPQVNTVSDDWCAFWRNHRLEYQLKLAATNGYVGRLQQLGGRLLNHLPELLSGAPAAALVAARRPVVRQCRLCQRR